VAVSLFPDLDRYLAGLRDESDQIDPQRRQTLRRLGTYLREQLSDPQRARIVFICTHNSRRSQLAQAWLTVFAAHFGYPGLEVYSGGTEVTACNPRTVAALERAGFRSKTPGGENPHYQLSFATDAPPVELWSKTWDDPANPAADFAAVMTCDEADANCPFIPGAAIRIPLTYTDPKVADATPEEQAHYDERTRQIGRELLWLVEELAISSPPLA
jgi:arsenate reductase